MSPTFAFFRRKSLQDLVAALTPRALVPLALAIFFLFSVVGVLTDLFNGARQPAAVVAANVIFGGVVALGYAYGGLWRRPAVLVLSAAVHLLYLEVIDVVISAYPPLPAADGPHRLAHEGLWIMAALVASYSCFLWFINGTAAGYLRVRAEIELAHQIQQVLVPVVEARVGSFEFFGYSQPSGEVGGDLVDVVPLAFAEAMTARSTTADETGAWFAYVADVSGHGVSSCLVMGMFKSAMRMRLREAGALASLLIDLNGVLFPLKGGNMFVTVACVRFTGSDASEFAVAGHLPILRVRGGHVDEITTPQIPIAMFESYPFSSSTIDVRPGDLLALITDGLIEVFDAEDREFGLERVKSLLAASSGQPLGEIANGLVSAARAHGKQLDDQTLLLIRRT